MTYHGTTRGIVRADSSESMVTDRFGNPMDRSVGYARGTILRGPLDEVRRRSRALAVLRARIDEHGRTAVFNFTGHRRGFPAGGRDLEEGLAEEWIGAACLATPLLEHTRRHFSAPPGVEAAVFNRAAAGIVALILAVGTGGRLVSVAPRGRAHTSVLRGAELAGARLDRRAPEELPDDTFRNSALAVITRVTSELEIMSADSTRRSIEAARDAGCPTLLDDAYGARIGPELLGQPGALELGADVAITSCDKAGLGGPRAGLMAGDPDLVTGALATGSEFGLEARGPIQLGVLRALQAFAPASLRADAAAGAGITAGLGAKFAQGRVGKTVMGPTITEDDVLSILRERGPVDSRLVPVEATSLLGMVLLERFGILTGNVAERPGARVSLRLRPTADEVARLGGASAVAGVVDGAMDGATELAADLDRARGVILGDGSESA